MKVKVIQEYSEKIFEERLNEHLKDEKYYIRKCGVRRMNSSDHFYAVLIKKDIPNGN